MFVCVYLFRIYRIFLEYMFIFLEFYGEVPRNIDIIMIDKFQKRMFIYFLRIEN